MSRSHHTVYRTGIAATESRSLDNFMALDRELSRINYVSGYQRVAFSQFNQSASRLLSLSERLGMSELKQNTTIIYT
jgi:hypothetical protein